MNKLVSAVDHLRGDIAMYDAQIQAQREETKAATRTLTDATTELEVGLFFIRITCIILFYSHNLSL